MIFQLLFAALTGAIMVYFVILTRRSTLRQLFVVFFFGTGLAFILDPGLTMRLAHLVGIGRGADLIFYLAILFLLFLCFNFYIRFHVLEEKVTHVVRALAMHNPVIEEDPGPVIVSSGDSEPRR